jgi:hypothetical protein
MNLYKAFLSYLAFSVLRKHSKHPIVNIMDEHSLLCGSAALKQLEWHLRADGTFALQALRLLYIPRTYNTQNLFIRTHLYVFHVIPSINCDYFLDIINWLIFVIETPCVL